MPVDIHTLLDSLLEKHQVEENPYIAKGPFPKSDYIPEPYEIDEEVSASYSGEMNPFYGLKHTEEWKEAHSKRMVGENNPFYGKRHTKETKQKISEKKNGTKMSEETKQKLREANKGKKMPKEAIAKTVAARSKTYYLTSPEGKNIIVTNLTKFCRENGLDQRNMSKMYAGLQKSSKGYIKWK